MEEKIRFHSFFRLRALEASEEFDIYWLQKGTVKVQVHKWWENHQYFDRKLARPQFKFSLFLGF